MFQVLGGNSADVEQPFGTGYTLKFNPGMNLTVNKFLSDARTKMIKSFTASRTDFFFHSVGDEREFSPMHIFTAAAQGDR